MGYTEYQKQFHKALDDEIQALRKSGGQKTFLSDGSLLGKRGGQYIYSFTTDTELRFPDDTPVDLEYKTKRYSGILVSVEGFDIILALQKNLGDSISTAILYTSPWFLLEELKKRLLESSNLKLSNRNLAEILLGDKTETNSSSSNSQKLLNQIEQRSQKPIGCNEYQKSAVDKVLNRQVSFIWGPPGTGKTKTLGITVAALVQAGESVLVVAHSNTAVDTAMKSVAQYLQGAPIYENGLVLRYGVATPGSLEEFPQLHVRGVARQQNPKLIEQIERLERQRRDLVKRSRIEKLTELQRQSIQNDIATVKQALQPLKEQLKQKEVELIKQATVVGCTLSKAAIAKEIYQRRFDAIVVDEASMAYIPHCAYISTLANRRIAIFGDFRQLGPISQAETEVAQEWLQRDIFDEAGITQKVNKGQIDLRMVLLKTQYRMNPAISKIPNQLFYNGQLQDGSGVEQKTMPIVQSQPHPGSALILYDLSQLSAFCFKEQQSHSRFNIISALVAVNLAYQSTQTNNSSVGIIAPYNAQARLIQRLLQDLDLTDKSVRVATVHRFQGAEQNIIIFDTVEGSPQAKAGKLVTGGTQSTAMRLANVAISRAQGKFIGLFNYQYIQQTLGSFNIFRKFVDRIYAQANIQSLTWALQPLSNLPGVTYFSQSQDALQQIKLDLIASKEEIAIAWSNSNNNQLPLSTLKRCSSRNIRFFITGKNRNSIATGLQNTHVWDNKADTNIGLVGIDRKCLWIYLNANSSLVPVIQIDLAQTTKLLYSFLRLVPEQDPGSITAKITQGENPFGQCPDCGQPRWYSRTEYGAYITCSKQPNHSRRKMNEKDTTLLMRFMNINCSVCKQQAIAYKSYKGIYIGCSQRNCNWSTSLESLI
ncbi:superfamily I DNA/RNA helicase (plasmid) [Tolypothrix tenuis PCC 7101]|uniref:Superfamily I DNA/RNA helicase n=1 Tax=Tolypothrix tenuis PCC 7101 TaxID=231146 RepID=A0A1Z4NB61_9CYAN|nr:AAA family ATPase [Aulosira sp. FACHB-113]BAZ02912.1 superfamily I DNA/RNA helicase [Tolypothrix tenuis PCC 7101]BAZ78165.1 superfamily I DNA/RNA helicase [Aulosira laxa NIES-50]